MKVAVIKYNSGNIRSVTNALDRLGAEVCVTDDPDEISSADKVIFPGVGEASSAMDHLRGKNLDSLIKNLTQPVLGICLGMQLLSEYSEENDTYCLGLLKGKVRRFVSENVKVPHVGWNSITSLSSPLFDGVADGSYVYFVHGYFVETGDRTTAQSDHGVPFSAAAEWRNFFAVQFHPEKSGKTGARILENFLNL